MTEGQFLECTDLEKLLVFLQNKISKRKFRLFACACCRAIWSCLEETASQRAVVVAEAFADGEVGRKELQAARKSAGQFGLYQAGWVAAYIAVGSDSWYAARDILEHVTRAITPSVEQEAPTEGPDASPCFLPLLRDIAGNPFRPVAVAPLWQTPTVVAIAQTIYVDHAFDHTPMLADALEEAGCTNTDILDHCRRHPPHARGCWVLDRLLGKE